MSEIVGFLDPRLIGKWVSPEGEFSKVMYQVTVLDGNPCVVAVDESDGEIAEVSDVRWNARTHELLFTCYWESTGRLAKCRFMRTGEDSVNFTYQYTDHELLVRSDA